MSSCAASCAVDVRGSVCEAARLQRVVVSQCDAASATARAWAHGVRLLDLCVDAQLGTLLCAVCDFAGTRTLAICVPPLLEGAAVPLADDDAAVVDAHARLQHALHCAPGVFRLTLVRTCDGRAVVVDCDVAARVGDQPLRVDALRALRRDLVAGSYDPAAFVRSCVKRTVPALEGEQWRVSVADNAAPLVRLLRASGLNQRFFGLARHYLPRSTLTDLDAPLLLHCVTVVVKRALWQAWAALPRDGDAARFELAVREAAADVLNKYLLPWQAASTAQPTSGAESDDEDLTALLPRTARGTPRHATLRAALVAHFGDAVLAVESDERTSSSDDSDAGSDTGSDADGSDADSSGSGSSNNSGSSSGSSSSSSSPATDQSAHSVSKTTTSSGASDGSAGARHVDPLRDVTAAQLLQQLEQVAGVAFNRMCLHRVQCNLPFLSEHITVRPLHQANRLPSLRVPASSMYALVARAKQLPDADVEALERNVAMELAVLQSDVAFVNARQQWRVQHLRGLVQLTHARLLTILGRPSNEETLAAERDLRAAEAAAPAGEPEIAFALASAEFDVSRLAANSSNMLRAIDRQHRAAERCSELKPFIDDKRCTVSDPTLISYFQDKLQRKSLLPIDLGTLNALVWHQDQTNK
jgi:hypothetical protein